MHSLYLGFGLCLLLAASAYGAEKKNEKDEKMLIMLEFEPIKSDDRSKRSSVGEAVRQGRQSPEVPQEYLSLLQQLAAQQQQQQPQQQAAATAQQPQNLIQQLVVSRDGSRQPTAARYVLTQDGRLLDESSLASYGQQQQFAQGFAQSQQLAQQLAQAQALRLPVYQPDPLQNTQPQQIPPAPAAPVQPGQRPQLTEFARQSQRILQEARDAPIRAQIAGFTIRNPNLPPQPVPTGPQSQSPQIYPPAGQQQQQPLALPAPYQDPNNPNIIYTPVPVDPQTYQLQLQQQLAAQYGIQTDPNQILAQNQAQNPPQNPRSNEPLTYQQPIPSDGTQERIRRPINVLPAQSANQPQVVPQTLPQQYLIETTRPSTPQPQQYVSADATPQIQYVQQPVQQPTPLAEPGQQPQIQQSTLLSPVAGRGLFSPIKPSRSSIYVSRSSAPKSVSLTISDDVTSEKVPVVRLPSPSGQRPLSKQELDALVSAGYAVAPVQDAQPIQYVKAKRQPVIQERRNQVVYENPQDGVQYQYSPGSADITASIRTKKSAPSSEYYKTL